MPARIQSVTLSSDETIEVSEHLTVIVGPNNVGKSVLLSSIWQRLATIPGNAVPPTPVLKSLNLQLPDRQYLETKLRRDAEVRPAGQFPQGYAPEPHFLLRTNEMLPLTGLDSILANASQSGSLGPLARVFAHIMQPEQRIGLLGQVAVPNLYSEQPTAPIQLLWHDRELEKKVQDLARRAFGIELTINRYGGSQIGLHVGRPTSLEPMPGQRSSYHRELAELPQAATQGHGMQAFLGIVLALVSSNYDIVLIDEPEAFLHPPQARLLGEVFVEFSRSGQQVIVSTHSDDFLQGVLAASGTSTSVTVARLTRPTHNKNAVAQVPSETVAKLYEDPLMRYSRILDGIFYKGVVICEAESDCKYYSAVLDHSCRQQPAQARPDLLFTQCGGKDRFAKAVLALQAVSVPTAVIADIDLLADRSKFTALLELMGGKPDALAPALNTITAAVQAKTKKPERDYLRHRIASILDGSTAKLLTPTEVGSIRDALKSESGWELAKKNGKGALPSGDATIAFEGIKEAAAAVGLFILPVGELERFHPNIGGNKQEWLRKVFESRSYEGASEAAALLGQVTAFIAGRQ